MAHGTSQANSLLTHCDCQSRAATLSINGCHVIHAVLSQNVMVVAHGPESAHQPNRLWESTDLHVSPFGNGFHMTLDTSVSATIVRRQSVSAHIVPKAHVPAEHRQSMCKAPGWQKEAWQCQRCALAISGDEEYSPSPPTPRRRGPAKNPAGTLTPPPPLVGFLACVSL